MAFGDWPALIAERQRLQRLVRGSPVVGDPLDTPPPAGQERTWLEQLLADAQTDVDVAKHWAASRLAGQNRKARELLEGVKSLLGRAERAVEDKAKELLPKYQQLGRDVDIALAGLAAVVTSPLWLPLLLYLAWRMLKGRR